MKRLTVTCDAHTDALRKDIDRNVEAVKRLKAMLAKLEKAIHLDREKIHVATASANLHSLYQFSRRFNRSSLVK